MPGTQRLWIERSDGPRLSGRLDLPDRASPDHRPRGYALLTHCFTCTKHYKVLARIAAVLVGRGWGVLRFDFTGLGESAGVFADTNLSSNVDDIRGACAFMRTRYGPVSVLAGHSLGGAAALLAASQLAEVRTVITIGTASRADYLAERLGDGAARLRAAGEAEVDVYGRPFHLRRQLLEDLSRHDVEGAVRGLGRPLLVIQPGADELVERWHADALFGWARPPRKLVVLEGADHLVGAEGDARRAGEEIADWAEEHGKTGGEVGEGPWDVYVGVGR